MSQSYLHTQSDAYGDIAVLREDDYRILSFGVGDEQSRQLTAKPHQLQHAYTQAMLLPLLWLAPKRVLILGLGAGSLLSALHHAVPGVRITAVELRQAVIDIAIRYFRLPQSKKIELHCAEAGAFMTTGLAKKQDLILTDLYLDHGMDAVQVGAQYIAQCAAQLKAEGWLVLNCWGELNEHTALLEQLEQRFNCVSSCDCGEGNMVIFASQQGVSLDRSALKGRIAQLSTRLDYDLARSFAKWT
ncbi:MAG: spermidine synthase [Pseudomonadales bacterium]